MSTLPLIPVFRLFGETGDFPDVIHHERIRDRALGHDWKIDAHRHRDMVQLFHMERGRAEVRIDDQVFALTDGEILYVPAQSVHGFSFLQGAEGSVLSLPLTLIADLPSASADLVARLARPAKLQASPQMLTVLSLLVPAFHGTGTFRASLLASLGQSLLTLIAGAAAEPEGSADPAIQRRMAGFDAALRARPDASLGAGDYARMLGITAGHMNRICRAATGLSASAYIEGARMTEARRLLAFTQLSVAEVGYRLGYGDPSYFSRRFRQVAGETPSEYRARFPG